MSDMQIEPSPLNLSLETPDIDFGDEIPAPVVSKPRQSIIRNPINLLKKLPDARVFIPRLPGHHWALIFVIIGILLFLGSRWFSGSRKNIYKHEDDEKYKNKK